MGVGKRIPLPAPTESTVFQASGDDIPTDIATDISRRTDHTSYSIPEDGRPITVSTAIKGEKNDKTQTSLLIEYFEGGKGPNTSSRPSVRVKVTPSTGKKGKDSKDHIQITESTGDRKPSYSRRISLPSRGAEETHIIEGGGYSGDSVQSGSVASKQTPIEIEVMHKDQGSDLSERRYAINPSEVSSMPPDSMLDGETPRKTRSGDVLKSGAAALGAAAVADKVIEKLGRDGISRSKYKSKSSSRSPSVSQEYLSETLSSPRRRSGKHRKLEESSEVSGVTDSHVSGTSYRSDTSKYSVTNPKLLQAVEDSIRRLILPELNAIKAKQRKDDESNGDISRRTSGRSEGGRSRDGSQQKRRSRNSDKHDGSQSERSFDHGMSQETIVHDGGHKGRRRSKESGKLKDAALGAAVGGLLTQAALKHHDSGSSLDRRERRKKRSKSTSRSHSVVSAGDTEEIFNKHDVAPMPMRSEITGSDMTRDSILSERTSAGSFEQHQAEIREIARVLPKQVYSSGRKTVKSPSALRHAQSYDDAEHQEEEDQSYTESYDSSPQKQRFGEDALAGVATGIGAGLLSSRGYNMHQNQGPGRYVHGRSLSPIQSVASYEERGMSRHNSQRKNQSTGSLSSLDKERQLQQISNRDAFDEQEYKKKNRALGVNLESRSEVLVGQDIKSSTPSGRRDVSHGSWYEGDEYNTNRNSGTSYDSSKVPVNRLTQYTDDSMDAPYLDKVAATQEVRDGAEGNAEWVHTTMAVESAVASLMEPSTLDDQSIRSSASYKHGNRLDSPSSEGRQEVNINRGYVDSPLKQTHGIDYNDQNGYTNHREMPLSVGAERSPRQSPPISTKDRDSFVPVMTGNAMPDLNDPMPEIMHMKSGSDISTNPPDIQGPKKYDSPMHWPYTAGAATGTDRGQLQTSNSAHDSLKAAAANMLSVAAGAGAAAALAQQHREADSYEPLNHKESVEDYGTVAQPAYTREMHGADSPFLKDEGYETNVPNRSPGALTPDHRHKGYPITGPDFGTGLEDDMDEDDDDVFAVDKLKRMSGNSHGMAPLYDAATGEGKDRIESKDIIALMDHLTVRDAQRNARDTEILKTLVQSAAEMRNSFEEMKQFISTQDNMIINVGQKQHDKTQRAIGGPRPLPTRTPRQGGSADDSMVDDIPQKRRNIIRRALKGLSGKSSNDLAKIEDMLHHLLDEVADLKAGQSMPGTHSIAHGTGLSSYEQLRDMPRDLQESYEPEGHADMGSGNHSGYLSPSPGRNSREPSSYQRKISQNRISTVIEEQEEDEPLTPSEQNILEYENTEHLLTPTGHRHRGASVPLGTPPKLAQEELPKSVENTPKTDKSRKHKSSSSSFFPRISRWSKTTTSTIPEKSSKQFANGSHSGLDLVNYDLSEHYDPQGDDRLGSQEYLDNDRPPSPLIPSELSRISEDPTYHAHRNSVNLQHPQPRQGPTARYQNHLESQVRDLSSPISPASDHFGSNPILARFNNNNGVSANRNSGAGHLTPNSDAGNRSSTGPARPPKIKDDGPLIPPKIPVQATSPSQLRPQKQTFLSRSTAGQEAEPQSSGSLPPSSKRIPLSPAPGRKPTGPRPLTSSGSYTPDKMAQLQRNRYRGSPNAIDVDSEVELVEAKRRGDAQDVKAEMENTSSNGDAESETF